MSIKLLHTADWHLGRKLEGRYRHREQAEVMAEICRIVEEEDVDAVLIAGDIYDAFNPPTESEALFYETVTRISDGGKRGVVVIAGNHDSPDRLTASDPYGRALGVVTIGYPKDIPTPFDRGEGRVACLDTSASFVRLRLRNAETLAILALPYPSEARLREVLTGRIDDENAALNYNSRLQEFMAEQSRSFREGEPSVVMSHLYAQGGKESESEREIQVGGAYSVNIASFPPAALYVALGHLHREQEFTTESGTIVRYSGSPLQYSFSEAEQKKSVTIVEIERNESKEITASHRTVPLSAGRQLIHRTNLNGLEEMERFLEEVDPEALISLEVKLDEAIPLGYLERIGARHSGVLKHIFIYSRNDQDEEQSTPVSQLSREEQFRRFVRERGEEPDQEVVDLFLNIISDEF